MIAIAGTFPALGRAPSVGSGARRSLQASKGRLAVAPHLARIRGHSVEPAAGRNRLCDDGYRVDPTFVDRSAGALSAHLRSDLRRAPAHSRKCVGDPRAARRRGARGARLLARAAFRFAAAISAHFTAFFNIAMACHGELARLRPAVDRLTEFYFWMSLGGVIGGALTALVSPLVFNGIIEYPLVLGLACLIQPAARRRQKADAPRKSHLLAAAIFVVLVEPAARLGPSLSRCRCRCGRLR